MDEETLRRVVQGAIAEALHPVDLELRTISLNIASINNEQRRTNGRLGALEEWRHATEVTEARRRGQAEGRAGMVLSRRAVTFWLGLASTLAALAGALGGLMTRL
jgi:hypothetical protein